MENYSQFVITLKAKVGQRVIVTPSDGMMMSQFARQFIGIVDRIITVYNTKGCHNTYEVILLKDQPGSEHWPPNMGSITVPEESLEPTDPPESEPMLINNNFSDYDTFLASAFIEAIALLSSASPLIQNASRSTPSALSRFDCDKWRYEYEYFLKSMIQKP